MKISNWARAFLSLENICRVEGSDPGLLDRMIAEGWTLDARRVMIPPPGLCTTGKQEGREIVYRDDNTGEVVKRTTLGEAQ